MKKIDNIIKIDAIIPWVNGNDENWQKKINTYLDKKIDFNKKKESVRFNSIGEINISIKSIIKHAPFFNTIYIVTDDQIPDSFDELHQLAKSSGINLEIVDHKVIFKDYEDFLPCFNSTSIISLIHRIPNLSEHYVLFNDDFFIMKSVTAEDFFVDGLPILRGRWENYYENLKIKTLYHKYFSTKKEKIRWNKGTLKKSMQLGAKLANDGHKYFLKRFHTPVSMRKSTLTDFFSDKENLLKNNIKYKFRDNNNQFITETLSNHLEIKNNTFVYNKKTKLTYFRNYKNYYWVRLKLCLFEKNKNKAFMTFQSLEIADNKTQEYIVNWLNKKLLK